MKIPEPRKLKSGSYFIQMRLNGVSVPVTASSRKGCIHQAELIKAEYQSGIREIKKIDADKTVGVAVDDYITLKEPVLSPSTVTGYTSIRKSTIPDWLLVKKTSSVTAKDLQKCINELAKVCSPKTVRNVMSLILASIIPIKPPLKNVKLSYPQKEVKEVVIPQEEDVKKLLSYIAGTDAEIPILLAATGSLRRSEIPALEKADIRKTGVWVSKAMVQNKKRQWVIKYPKNPSSNRLAKLPPEVIEKLNSVKGDKLVSLNPNQIYYKFKKAAAKAGIPDCTFHALRHYWASVAQMLGMPQYYIMRDGGWTTMSTPNKIYTHIMTTADEANYKKLSDHYKTIANKNANADEKVQ